MKINKAIVTGSQIPENSVKRIENKSSAVVGEAQQQTSLNQLRDLKTQGAHLKSEVQMSNLARTTQLSQTLDAVAQQLQGSLNKTATPEKTEDSSGKLPGLPSNEKKPPSVSNDEKLLNDPLKQQSALKGGNKFGNSVRDQLNQRGITGVPTQYLDGGNNPALQRATSDAHTDHPKALENISPAFQSGPNPWDFKTSQEASAARTSAIEIVADDGMNLIMHDDGDVIYERFGKDKKESEPDKVIVNSDFSVDIWHKKSENQQQQSKSQANKSQDQKPKATNAPSSEKKSTPPPKDDKKSRPWDNDPAVLKPDQNALQAAIKQRQNRFAEEAEQTSSNDLQTIAAKTAIGLMSKVNPNPQSEPPYAGPIVIPDNPITDPTEPQTGTAGRIRPRKPEPLPKGGPANPKSQ